MPAPMIGAAPNALKARAGRDVAISLDDDALILHTSGTTGKSKRVPFSLRRLLASGNALAGSLELRESDVGLNMMPLHHVGGITCNLMAPLLSKVP